MKDGFYRKIQFILNGKKEINPKAGVLRKCYLFGGIVRK